MREVIFTCDRCGSKGGSSWNNLIVGVFVQTPPDGINHGVYKHDLCASCRASLSELASKFFRGEALTIQKVRKGNK